LQVEKDASKGASFCISDAAGWDKDKKAGIPFGLPASFY